MPKHNLMTLKHSGGIPSGWMSRKWNCLKDRGPITSGINATQRRKLCIPTVWEFSAASGFEKLTIIKGKMISGVYQKLLRDSIRSWLDAQVQLGYGPGRDPKYKCQCAWIKKKWNNWNNYARYCVQKIEEIKNILLHDTAQFTANILDSRLLLQIFSFLLVVAALGKISPWLHYLQMVSYLHEYEKTKTEWWLYWFSSEIFLHIKKKTKDINFFF